MVSVESKPGRAALELSGEFQSPSFSRQKLLSDFRSYCAQIPVTLPGLPRGCRAVTTATECEVSRLHGREGRHGRKRVNDHPETGEARRHEI